MYRWKRSLDQGLKESGEMVPKSQMLGLQKRIEELERALGRKALEVDLFKKSTSSRGSDYPRGHKVARTGHRMFIGVRLSGAGQAPELALLSTADRAGAPVKTAGRGDGDQPTRGSQPGLLWLPTDSRAAQASRLGGSVLRQFQARLRVPGVLGNFGEGGAPGAGVDRALQPTRPAQRLRDAVTGRVLCGMESQKQDTTCPKLSGAVHVSDPATVVSFQIHGHIESHPSMDHSSDLGGEREKLC